ncbi:glycosyltransferase family 2 protein [Shewanella gelidimarina]|uniref:glycosyltransferase family 2 protein n=1 Tax=Shewanella gelidimarina TaxID=56813 RepID=UPI002010AD5A|nr:glycosyltransferase family 2 protein [Shewanella gelidimarina]MCL1056396.1 glycosyltransferase family 2 protein [Shewanella gelidimarina]
MIVIPMAGLSSRFFKAGYNKPKYMLLAHGITLFDHAILSFQAYFDTLPFLFIVRSEYDTPSFVETSCRKLGIKNYQIKVLTAETRGQAETVYLGLKDIEDDMPITIFNIDTFRPNFTLPELVSDCDGYLEVFKGKGSNWSYAKPLSSTSNRVIETAEKNPISDLCSTGLYHFSYAKDFKRIFNLEATRPISEWQKQELYIAPLYNHMISEGKDIRYNLIDRSDVIFCGVPDEYLDFIQ